MLGKYIENLSMTLQRYRAAAFVLFFSFITMASTHALAQDVSDVADNVVESVTDLPGLVTALAYVIGLLFGIRGILKLKAHVENPGDGAGQTPIRTPMISFGVGGAFFILPVILQAAANTFGIEALGGFGTFGTDAASAASASGSVIPNVDINQVLNNIITSLGSLPGLVTALSYLFGIVMIVVGLLKTKEHVENPDQVKLQEPVIRLLAGGALLAMPAIFNAMFATIDAGTGSDTAITNVFGFDFRLSDYVDAGAATACTGGGGAGATTGNLMCNILTHVGFFPAFLTAISYLFGLVMGVWGIFKIRDHVLNPQQTTIFEGVTRLLAGGAFFALPFIVDVVSTTLDGGGGLSTAGAVISGYNIDGSITGACAGGGGGGGALGLDGVLACFADDMLGPVHAVLNIFAFVAGIIFIMIGISRLIKGAQEGARGPGGLGTMMSFAMGGALISYNEIMRAATTTLVSSSQTATFATLRYDDGLSTDEANAAHAVISSILKFMIIVGLISFVRGLFIVRSVAEGNQQASMMAAITHIVGGALAVNLGPVLNAVQTTLGTTGYGIEFTL